jgi:ABC-type transport system involved in multi-copper enzyme maturation permease subunit
MTASTITGTQPLPHQSARTDALLGLRPLLRKDLAEWAHGPRAWIVLVVTAAFMALTAANSWINTWLIANLPSDAVVSHGPISMAPLDNVSAAIGSQIFVIAAIFASMSLLVTERENGALAWLASKPVARGAIWMSKTLAAASVLWLVAAILPLAIVGVVVTILYGIPAIVPMVGLAIGAGAAIAFFVAVVLTASTFVSSQPAVAAIGLAVMFLPTIVAGIVPVDIAPFLPTSILTWAGGLAMGADVGFATPIAWAVSMLALTAIAIRRMDGLEL